ncbi:MAG TPA: hypothetical protein VG322_08115, partial [Candidatus Acidoferrales bacterium]|nr:hypothetical protein [Candidatus Acidoferrales bacterium]
MGGGNSHQRKMAAKAKERMADEVTERVLQKIEANPIAARAPNTNVEPKITSPSIKEKLGVFWGSTPVWSAICLLIGAYASQVSLKLLWFGAWVVLSSEIWRVRFFEGRTLKVVGNVTLSLILATVIYQIWKKSPKPEQPLPIDQKLNTFGD